jgi:hypothetical protein
MSSLTGYTTQELTIFDNDLPEDKGFNLQYLHIPQNQWGNEVDFLNSLLERLSTTEKQEIILFFQDLCSGNVIISERSLKNTARNRLTKDYLDSLQYPAETQEESNALRRAHLTRLEAVFLILVARHILLREGAMNMILSSNDFQQRFGAFITDIRKGEEIHDTVDNFKKFMLPLLALESKGIATGFYNRKDGLILEVCTIYENSGKKYVTGGGPSHATKRRQAARDLITGNNRAPRKAKKRKSPTSSVTTSASTSTSTGMQKKVTKKQNTTEKLKSSPSKKQKVNSFNFTCYQPSYNFIDSDGNDSEDDSVSAPTVSSLSSPAGSSSDEESLNQNKTFTRSSSLNFLGSAVLDDLSDVSKHSVFDEPQHGAW